MTQVSTFRLYVLRGGYLLLFVGLGFSIWPAIVSHSLSLPHMNGVVLSVLGALGLLCALGLRYPLQMLPLLIFELVWKTIWTLAFAWPLWAAGALMPEQVQSMKEIVPGVLLMAVVIPWPYVWAQYVKQPGERWKRAA
jgi:hypothetical protein